MAQGVVIQSDSVRSAAMRHEIPVGIIDPFTYLEVDGRRIVVVSVMEADRVKAAVPEAELVDPAELGMDELAKAGLRWDELAVELTLRACQRYGVDSVKVPGEAPVALADRLREEGIEVTPDQVEFIRRRRVKSEIEVAGVRRAQAAANEAMAVAAELLREAWDRDGVLHHRGDALTAEALRTRMRELCAARGAPLGDDVIVGAGAAGASGHEPGSGPLPSGIPIVIDIWPQDEKSSCWADMTRTFVAGGEPAADIVEMHALCLEAMERVREAVRPGVTGLELFEIACDVFEAAGHPTQRTKPEGVPLRDGFYHSLGHGVGLEVHEEPALGRSGRSPLVAGDVIAVEPGTYRHGYGGVRLEDLLLVTSDGCEVLADFPYDLKP